MVKLFEKYTELKDIKEELFIKAIRTGDTDMIDFFINRGADLNAENVLLEGGDFEDVFRHLLKKGSSIKKANLNYRFKDLLKQDSIQKILIDFDYVLFLDETVGINDNLKNDPKYKDIVDRFEDAKKYNL